MDYVRDVWRSGLYVPAFFVHHKEYITDKNYEDDNIFFNIDNTESLCKKCHNQEHFSNKEEYYFNEKGDLIKYDWKRYFRIKVRYI